MVNSWALCVKESEKFDPSVLSCQVNKIYAETYETKHD